MAWICLIMGFTVFPSAFQKWRVPFGPESAVLTSRGDIFLFYEKDGYVYDYEGNLKEKFPLIFKASQVFIGPNDTIWLHDGEQLMGCLNENRKIRWQMDLEQPSVPPRFYGERLVYAVGTRLFVIEPSNGQLKYSLYGKYRISSVLVENDLILIANSEGGIVSWHPKSGQEQVIFTPSPQELRFLSVAPNGNWALAFTDGLLRVYNESRKVRWKRHFRIEVSVPPVWLQAEETHQLLVAHHGRRVFAYSSRGEELASMLMPGRPKAVVALNSRQCLIIPDLVGELIWYHSDRKAFEVQETSTRQNLVVSNQSYLLLVGGDGIISLFRRN